MVDKTKRAVSVLQQRCGQDREELLAWARKTAEETEAEVKRRAGMQEKNRSEGEHVLKLLFHLDRSRALALCCNIFST